MSIIVCDGFQQQLQTIMRPMITRDPVGAKKFKLYLDTVLLNLPTKARKYKRSIYINRAGVRDIEHQGYTIPFYHDSANGTFVILGIIDNRNTTEGS